MTLAKEPEESQEPTYEVKDKRRVNADGTLKEEAQQAEQVPQEEAAAETPEQAEAETGAEQEEMPPPNVYAVLQFVLGLLVEQSWELMGIRLAPGQKEMVKDLPQAKLAIDTVAFISEKLQPQLDDENRRALRGMISDLQMNFVRVSGE